MAVYFYSNTLLEYVVLIHPKKPSVRHLNSSDVLLAVIMCKSPISGQQRHTCFHDAICRICSTLYNCRKQKNVKEADRVILLFQDSHMLS